MKLQLAVAALALTLSTGTTAATSWASVDQALGRPGAVQAGDVHRYSFPRADLSVTLDGIRIKPALALGSWLAFRDIGDHAEVMGDLVLTQEEVNPVLSLLVQSGLTITALHNHLLRSAPGTMYMHVHGSGNAVKLATALRQALGASRTPLGAPPSGAPLFGCARRSRQASSTRSRRRTRCHFAPRRRSPPRPRRRCRRPRRT